MTDYDQRALLNELEPEAGRLYDRHAAVAQEWFPHDYIPYRLGRDFDKAEEAARLAEHLAKLDAAAVRFEERLGSSSVPRMSTSGG
jgi:hypothetical protein